MLMTMMRKRIIQSYSPSRIFLLFDKEFCGRICYKLYVGTSRRSAIFWGAGEEVLAVGTVAGP